LSKQKSLDLFAVLLQEAETNENITKLIIPETGYLCLHSRNEAAVFTKEIRITSKTETAMTEQIDCEEDVHGFVRFPYLIQSDSVYSV
jgi:hypothetical protein